MEPLFKTFNIEQLFTPISLESLRVGLDIGEFEVKCALVDYKKKIIKNLWKTEIFPERSSKDDVLSKEEFYKRVRKRFSDFKRGNQYLVSSVNTVIQGETTVCRYTELPRVSKRELDVAVQSQALKFIPFSPEQVNIAYINVPPIVHNEKKMAVFWAAARKDTVESYKKTLNSAGFDVNRIEIPVFPLVREINANHCFVKDQLTAIVNCGYRLTHVVILKNGYPYYAREISFGGRDFTYGLQMGAQSTWEAAEHYKYKYDLESKKSSIEPFIERWLKEIRNSLDYFKENVAQEKVEIGKIYLSGGMAVWKNFDTALSEFLGIDVEIDGWDRLKLMDKSVQGEPASYKLAVGLTLDSRERDNICNRGG